MTIESVLLAFFLPLLSQFVRSPHRGTRVQRRRKTTNHRYHDTEGKKERYSEVCRQKRTGIYGWEEGHSRGNRRRIM